MPGKESLFDFFNLWFYLMDGEGVRVNFWILLNLVQSKKKFLICFSFLFPRSNHDESSVIVFNKDKGIAMDVTWHWHKMPTILVSWKEPFLLVTSLLMSLPVWRRGSALHLASMTPALGYKTAACAGWSDKTTSLFMLILVIKTLVIGK